MGEGWRAVKKARGGLGGRMDKKPEFDAEAARQARLAAALRANLSRRKARDRASAASAASAEAGKD